jgi:hypothetical protein
MIRVLKTLVALSALIGSMMVFTGGAASADPYWQTFTVTSAFHCSSQYSHPTVAGVTVQTCVVVNGTATQSVGIVRNAGSTAVSLAAPHVRLYVNGTLSYDRYCLSSTLSAGYARACFAPTQVRPCSAVMTAEVNFVVQGYSIWPAASRQMCT